MTESQKVTSTAEAWENRELGADEEFVRVADDIDISDLQKSLKLQMISIRLQESLIEDLKFIAQLHGVGYQPLMKQVLTRFADSEKKRILREQASKQKKEIAENGCPSDEGNPLDVACG
ncbi:MAG: CopG family antitoxin [Candidatus Sedimenticola sp. (ex Thyasira tokunagai)]